MTGNMAGVEDTGVPPSCEQLPQGRAQRKGGSERVEREGWQETEREAGKEEEGSRRGIWEKPEQLH